MPSWITVQHDKNPTKHVGVVQCNLFLMWYSWKTTHLAVNQPSLHSLKISEIEHWPATIKMWFYKKGDLFKEVCVLYTEWRAAILKWTHKKIWPSPRNENLNLHVLVRTKFLEFILYIDILYIKIKTEKITGPNKVLLVLGRRSLLIVRIVYHNKRCLCIYHTKLFPSREAIYLIR